MTTDELLRGLLLDLDFVCGIIAKLEMIRELEPARLIVPRDIATFMTVVNTWFEFHRN